MTRDELNLLKDIAELTAEVSALRSENKCLREDRDAWKEYAMRTIPPTVAAPVQNVPIVDVRPEPCARTQHARTGRSSLS